MAKRGRKPKNQTGSNELENNQETESTVINEKKEVSTSDLLNDLKDEYNETIEEQPKKKSKYVSKKVKEQEEQQKAESFSNNVSGIGSTVINIFFDRVGYQKLSEVETQKLDSTLDAVIMKYAPVVGGYQEETALGMVLLMILLPRTKFLTSKTIETHKSESNEK